MAKICSTCKAEIVGSAKKSSPWLPVLTAIGVSAAAIYVLKRVRRAANPLRISEDLVSSCAKAARDLDRRLDDAAMKFAN
jgi:hypothetical protein